MLRWDLLKLCWRGGKLAFFVVKWGRTAPKVSVSAVRKAEKGTCHVGTFCVAGGEVETLANFGLKWGRTAHRRVSRL